MKRPICPFCTSDRLEPNAMKDTVRVYTCLDCGTTTKATIVVNLKALIGLCKQERKITAVKMHRAKTGTGLKEAKDFIDQLSHYV